MSGWHREEKLEVEKGSKQWLSLLEETVSGAQSLAWLVLWGN